MGTPEIVVKRARPCSSTLVPVGAPIARSGAFSRVGNSVFSAQFASASEGWRFSNTSAIGLSATCGFEGFFPGMDTLVYCCDDREAGGEGARRCDVIGRPVGTGVSLCGLPPVDCHPVSND